MILEYGAAFFTSAVEIGAKALGGPRRLCYPITKIIGHEEYSSAQGVVPGLEDRSGINHTSHKRDAIGCFEDVSTVVQ